MSPDGSNVLFCASYHKSTEKEEPSRFFVVPIHGGELTELQTGMKWVYQPAWSPDGRELAYLTEFKIFRLERASGKREEEPTGPADAHLMQPAWSRDGKTMAFSALQGGEPGLFLMENFVPLARGRR